MKTTKYALIYAKGKVLKRTGYDTASKAKNDYPECEKVEYRIAKGVCLGVEHNCWHPIVNYGHEPNGVYGAKTGIYIKLN